MGAAVVAAGGPAPVAVGVLLEAVACCSIGGRVEATGALEQLEGLAAFALARLAIDALPWAPQELTAPRGTTIGGVEYLVARAVVQMPIDAGKLPASLAVA